MVILYILKILSESGFLLIIAGPVLCAFGFDPVFLLAIYPLYALYMFAAKRSMPVRDHQIDVFKYSCWAALTMLFGCLLFGASSRIMTILIGSTLISISSSVLLLRSLRHDPEVYTGRAFQVMNLLIMAAVLAAIFLLSSKPVMNALLFVLKTVYQAFVTVLLWLITAIAQVVVSLLSWLAELFGFHGIQFKEQDIDLSGLQAQEVMETSDETVGTPLWLKVILCGGFAAVVCAVVWYVLRRLSGERIRSSRTQGKRDEVTRTRSSVSGGSRGHESSSVQGIRKQYRKYLSMLREKGQLIEPADTSGDIEKYPLPVHESAEAAELRSLYIRARYGENTCDDDRKRAAELVKEIKKWKT